MKRAVIIVAGGKGVRMGAQIPKQFLQLSGVPILCRTINQFIQFDPDIEIFLTLPTEHFALWLQLSAAWVAPNRCRLVEGGSERFFSVKNALDLVEDDIDLIAVHDGVRPLIGVSTIARCFAEAALKGNAVPVINPSESVRIVADGNSKIIDRSTVKLVQTPQVFNTSELKKAYQLPYTKMFTDDASVLETYGGKINLVEGDKTNVKITTFEDLQYAEFIFNQNKRQ